MFRNQVLCKEAAPLKSLAPSNWILIVLILSFCTPGIAKKTKKEKKKTPPKAVIVERKIPTPLELEQQAMKYISLSVLEGDKAHWASEATPDNPPVEILIVESPATGQKDRGNILVIARPGIYPYQARWYPGFRQQMTSKGWQILSLGLSPSPQKGQTTRSQIVQLKDVERKVIVKEQQENFTKQNTQWESQAISRGQLLTTFSNNNNVTTQAILIGVGLSAHVAGLIAADQGTQLTGLVLIDLESPPSEAANSLPDKLSQQGPILDIVTGSKSHIIRAAKRRKQLAAKAGNKDYRLVFAPAGFELDTASQSWLTATIHGWAMTSQKKSNTD